MSLRKKNTNMSILCVRDRKYLSFKIKLCNTESKPRINTCPRDNVWFLQKIIIS